MNNSPSGTVTFLFTDIEGSTKLAQEFPDTLPLALEKHHSILREAIESNNGFVFEIIGDAFCAAFENANDAVNSAYEAQLNLAKENWDDAVIKVRMGIHSGKVEWNGQRYMGYITLARTARVMSAAYGEQILISNDTFDLRKENIPNEISFRDLGERRLKDVIQPIRLFQIISPGLREDFPPLKTLDARPNNLPVQLTSFIGREEEMKQVKNLLKQTHLLTLTGSGGAGKTRLALQIAADVIDDFANGVWFVELASLSEAFLLPQAIMKALGVQEQPKQRVEDTLIDYLKDKEILIIVDNCEHLVDAVAELAEKMLSNSPKLKIIATSREALRTSGELTHRILSLEVPNPKDTESAENLTQYEAVRLFIERALSVDETFRVNNNNAPALAGICHQLDGIPLAIELAAARTRALSVEQIYERLDDRFNLLTGGKRTALPRQQTLRALIDWSYDLLSEKEKIFWNRLSVFSGGWTLEAAEEICSDEKINKKEIVDLLTDLTEKSIIIFNKEEERYRMLETIKQYGEEKLSEADEFKKIADRHLKFYMDFAETAENGLEGTEINLWMKKLNEESDNFDIGILWSLEDENRENGLRIAGALGYFWEVQGMYSEGIRWLESVIANNQRTINSFYGKALNAAGNLSRNQGSYEKAEKYLEDSLAISRELRDRQGIAKSLGNLGTIAWHQGDYKRSVLLSEESFEIHKEMGNKLGISKSLLNLGAVAYFQADFIRAAKIFEDDLSICKEIGYKYGVVFSLINLGHVAYEQNDLMRAAELFEESLAITREMGYRKGVALTLMGLGILALKQDDFIRAEELQRESLAIFKEIGNKQGVAISLSNLGSVAYSQGKYIRASELYEESLAIYRKINQKHGIILALISLGNIAYYRNEYNNVAPLLEESLKISRDIGAKSEIASSLEALGRIAFKKEDYEQARILYNESLTLNRETGRKGEIAINILGFTELHIINKFYNRATKLLGFIESFFETNKTKLIKPELDKFEEIASKLKEKLGEEVYSKYFAEGKLLTVDEAIELALREREDYE